MEYRPTRFGGLTFSEPVLDTKLAGWHVVNHSVQMSEVICPQPRRAVRVPCLVDGLSRYNCKTKSFNVHREDSMDILDFILNKDDTHGEFEANNFFCGSPPVRLGNPLVHDPEFAKQSMSVASPTGNSNIGGKFSPRLERSIPSRGSSCSGSPKVRIEGFASGASEYHPVSAHA